MTTDCATPSRRTAWDVAAREFLATAVGVPDWMVRAERVENGVWQARVDPAWPEQRVMVEYEGAYHFNGLQLVRDEARYRRLVAAGRRVIRLAAHDVRDMDAVVARIRSALGAELIRG
jgi:very-short-patch-repair endonuclease